MENPTSKINKMKEWYINGVGWALTQANCLCVRWVQPHLCAHSIIEPNTLMDSLQSFPFVIVIFTLPHIVKLLVDGMLLVLSSLSGIFTLQA